MKPWWQRLTAYARPEARMLGIILVLMIVGIGVNLLMPWPLKLIVDSVLAEKPLPGVVQWITSLPGASSAHGQLAWLAAATVLLFLASRLVTIVQTYLQAGAGSRMIYGLAADLYTHLQRQSLLFHTRRRSGDLVRRVTADCQCVRKLIISVYFPLLTSVITLVAMFCVMWQLNRELAVAALLIAIPLGICVRLFGRSLTERCYHEQELQGELVSVAEQSLTAMPLIKSFQREPKEVSQYRALTAQAVQANFRLALSAQQFKVATNAVTAVATSLVMVAGGYYVLQGSLTVGTLIVLLSYFAALYSPLETLAYLTESVASAAAGARRVFQVLDADEGEVKEASQAIMLNTQASGKGRSVSFENVTFGYEPGQAVLHNLSFDVKPGEFIAIVGPTGAGKSTLISLIPRFFDPWEGCVRIDGHDLRELELADLRKQIALVLQEPFLLPLSIAENIAYGRPDAGRDEVIAAAEAAHAGQFIEKRPDGYDTVIGERGITLSGGEKQRLSIARALLKDASIVILDEPSASLDAATESLVMGAIGRLVENRTTFVIAHRLSTIKNADFLLVLEDGQLREFGKPENILEGGGFPKRVTSHRAGSSSTELISCNGIF